MPSAFCYHAKPGGGKSEDLFPGDKSEHPYSWLDDTEVTAMSADGRFISIYEAGEVYALENSSLAYYRATDGSPAARLGVGTAAISPDGKCFPRMGIPSHGETGVSGSRFIARRKASRPKSERRLRTNIPSVS
jgi:hypothetical protein